MKTEGRKKKTTIETEDMARVRIEIGSRLRKLILGGFLLLIFGSLNIYFLSSMGYNNDTQERAMNQMLENELAKNDWETSSLII